MARGPLNRRLNQTRPVSRVANRAAATNAARAELERKLASKPIGQRPTDSDDSDRLVVKGNGRRGRNVVKQEIYATGAVGTGDTPGSYPTRAQRKRSLNDDTNEMLARRQSQERKNEDSSLDSSISPRHHKPSLANGVVNKSTSMPQLAAHPTTTISSAIKAPGSILRMTQPTPARETSFLGSLKPRRRQPSILQQIDHDSSSFGLDGEEEFLPDAVSTPLNLSKTRTTLSNPNTTSSQPSTTRKRKLGQSDPLQPTEDLNQPTSRSPLSTMHPRRLTPEPVLPSVPISTLRASGLKLRDGFVDAVDIMAPPQSSSSPAPSTVEAKASVRPKNTRKKAPVKPAPAMTTEELQAAMMPTKRRRTARERIRTQPTEFEIPADSNSPDDELDEDSSFLPTRKGRKPRKGREAASTTQPKPGNGKPGRATAGGKQKGTANPTAKLKQSTRNLITTTAITTSAVLSPSTSRRNRETKSPSQLSSIAASTTTRSTKASISATALDPAPRLAVGSKKRYGGSPNPHAGGRHLADKENQPSSTDPFRGEDSDGGDDSPADPSVKKTAVGALPRNKWADIDAWDMDFEEIEVMTPSGSGGSSPMKR